MLVLSIETRQGKQGHEREGKAKGESPPIPFSYRTSQPTDPLHVYFKNTDKGLSSSAVNRGERTALPSSTPSLLPPPLPYCHHNLMYGSPSTRSSPSSPPLCTLSWAQTPHPLTTLTHSTPRFLPFSKSLNAPFQLVG